MVSFHTGQEVEEDEVVCQVPKIDFADLLELIVRTGALDVDYLRPKKQPPADGLGRGRVTEFEILQDAIKTSQDTSGRVQDSVQRCFETVCNANMI